MYSAKSYHKESIGNSGNAIREWKEKTVMSACTSQGALLSSTYFSVALCAHHFSCVPRSTSLSIFTFKHYRHFKASEQPEP